MESSLYARFLALTSKFDLVPAEFLVIPTSQYGGEGERDHRHDGHERDPPRQQHLEPIPRASVAPEIQQHQYGIDRPRSPLISTSPDPSSISTGGIGEHPTAGNGPRPRFGRNRTDTMVFADIEYNGVADELAAKARAGEFDVNYETEAPKSARLITESVFNESREEEPSDIDLESESHFEISLDEEMKTELVESDILSAEVKTERNEAEPPIPEFEEESTVFTADSIDSATMDEHILATISEDVDEPETSDVTDAEAESVPTQINSEVDLTSVDELETDAPLVSGVSHSSNAIPADDSPNVENELVVEPTQVQPTSDHLAQADTENEDDTSPAGISDTQEAQTTVTS